MPGPYPRLTLADGRIEVVLIPGADRSAVSFRLEDGRLTAIEDAAPPPGADTAATVTAIVDEAVTGMVADLTALGDEVDALDEGEGDLAALRRRVARFRRAALAQRDVVGRLAALSQPRLRLDGAAERMGIVVAELDVLREEIYEAASDRREEVMRRLTVVAAIFLPLTFLTGFFGQNFPWMVEHIGGPWWFVVLAIALPVVVVAGLLGFFRLKRWL